MIQLMKQNMILGVILDLLITGGIVILVKYIMSLVEKAPFVLD